MFRLTVLAAAVLIVQACAGPADAAVVVVNAGSQRIDVVRVDAGGRLIELGGIEAARRKSVRPVIEQDSSVSVRYLEAGREVVCMGDVYLTQNVRARIEVAVGEGTCKVVDATR